MGLGNLFNKKESLIAIDIGSSNIKLLELDLSTDPPQLVNIGLAPLDQDVFANNVIENMDYVSEQITSLLETYAVEDRRVVTAMPGPSVFTKKIKMPKLDPDELASNIQFEAGNFIPHNIDAVRLDYHIIGESGKNQLDILVVAVKNEIIDSFMDCLSLAGLETAIVDVDYFALQNVFEVNYPEFFEQTVALINIGARYSSINICREGESLFTGDMAVGGKIFNDALIAELGVTAEESESLKFDCGEEAGRKEEVQDVIDRNVEYVASEFNRQLSFFWNASGADEGIDQIMLTGGSSLVPGLKEELSEKTGLECALLDPLRVIESGENFDKGYLAEISPQMAVAVGLGLRELGDKIVPEYE